MSEQAGLIPIYIMGKRYEVPASLTIMKAMEWAGYTLVRGAGCRSGFCGACATVYRIKDDPRLYFGLGLPDRGQAGNVPGADSFLPRQARQLRYQPAQSRSRHTI